MEYCEEGTLEAAACPEGLPEAVIRQYTRGLLNGVSFLHQKSIAHRDIKGANIFLTKGMTVKLGDFGCSAKLQSGTTMPGEFSGVVGTTAYMAPEIITHSEGHGRAADIWSIGCVIYQMYTGHRPWHHMDNDYQIMFKVGMGGTPVVPEHLLSEEGHVFINRCLVHDPQARSAAEELLQDPFIKVADSVDHPGGGSQDSL